jgi:hypothetical protein
MPWFNLERLPQALADAAQVPGGLRNKRISLPVTQIKETEPYRSRFAASVVPVEELER